MLADQSVTVNQEADTEAAHIPLSAEESVSHIQLTVQAGTGTRSKRNLVPTPHIEGVKKPNHEEHQKRFVNPIPQQLVKGGNSREWHSHSEIIKRANGKKRTGLFLEPRVTKLVLTRT